MDPDPRIRDFEVMEFSFMYRVCAYMRMYVCVYPCSDEIFQSRYLFSFFFYLFIVFVQHVTSSETFLITTMYILCVCVCFGYEWAVHLFAQVGGCTRAANTKLTFTLSET